MRLPFSCPNCDAHYLVPSEFEGKNISCTKCGQQIEIHLDTSTAITEDTQSDALFIHVDDYTLLTGKLALKLNYLTREQLKEYIQKQQNLREAGEEILFGELLVRDGVLAEIQRNYIVSVLELNEIHKNDELFSLIVIQNQFASQAQVDKCFKLQKNLFNKKQISRPIAEIFIEAGTITLPQHESIITVQERIKQLIVKSGSSESIEELVAKEGMITSEELTSLQSGENEEFKKESLPPPVNINVSMDSLSATLVIAPDTTEAPSLVAVKEKLAQLRIVHDLTPDDEIEQFLDGDPKPGDTLQLASGVGTKKSENAWVECHFDEDPLKIGQMKENGVIDFKDRGDIPQVKAGEVIARKIPARLGESGIDVFGKVNEARQPLDCKLRCGKGGEMSADKMSIIAKMDGKAVKTLTGVIDVQPLLQIRGDIGLETGHVHFDGEIQVGGMVETGFKVTGGSMTVNELDGATVDVRGDLNVKGGIIKSDVRVGGNLKARYIRKSNINVVGDAAVASEVMQSEVEIGGGLFSEKCHLFGSTITAGGDITFHDIGSGASRPSVITLAGARDYTAKKEEFANTITTQQERIDKITSKIGELEKKKKSVDAMVGKAAQKQDKMMVKKREEPDTPNIAKEFKAAEEKLSALLKSQEKITNGVQMLKTKQQECRAEIENIEHEIAELDALREKESKNRQYLHVKGALYEKTTVKGLRTSLTTDTTINKVTIFEDSYTDKNGIETWVMKVEALKV